MRHRGVIRYSIPLCGTIVHVSKSPGSIVKMTSKTKITIDRDAGGFSTYCFVIRSCLEREFHEPPQSITAFMERNREHLFTMYSTAVPAAAAVLALALEFEAAECAW